MASAARMFSLLAIKGFFLLLAGCALGQVCELPPKDNLVLSSLIECTKTEDKLCILKCVGLRTGAILPEGKVDKARMRELIAGECPEGGLKDAFTEFDKKCFKESNRYDMKDKDCIGFAQTGMCFVKVMQKRCPNVAEIVKQNF